MNGPLISSHFPYLPVTIAVGQERHVYPELEALLDTGFDGDAVLPTGIASDAALPDWYITCRLADGSEIDAPAYVGAVRVGTTELSPVVVAVLGDEPIIGRGVISAFTITLDLGQRVIVHR